MEKSTWFKIKDIKKKRYNKTNGDIRQQIPARANLHYSVASDRPVLYWFNDATAS